MSFCFAALKMYNAELRKRTHCLSYFLEEEKRLCWLRLKYIEKKLFRNLSKSASFDRLIIQYTLFFKDPSVVNLSSLCFQGPFASFFYLEISRAHLLICLLAQLPTKICAFSSVDVQCTADRCPNIPFNFLWRKHYIKETLIEKYFIYK